MKNKIKLWKEVAKPNSVVWFFQIILYLFSSVFSILTTLPNAKAINSLVIFDFDNTVYYLSISLVFFVFSKILHSICYRLDTKQLFYIYPNIQQKIFDKIFISSDQSFSLNSKEKMINIITDNLAGLSDFCDRFAIKISNLASSLLTIGIIFYYNTLVGLIVLSSSFVILFLMKLVNSAIMKKTVLIYNQRDKLTETFANIVENRLISQDFDLKENLKSIYFSNVNSILKSYKKRTNLKSVRDNFINILYTIIIFALTVYLVKLVRLNTITSTIYLVIVPYLTSSINYLLNFFEIFADVETAFLNASRVKTLLDMDEKDLSMFGNNTTENLEGAITFSYVSYKGENQNLGSLEPFFAQIEKHQTVLFQGNKGCGKRAIFYMLRRAIKPTTGTITLDTINIYDFAQHTYIKNLAYVTYKPHFYIGTIMDNLKLVEKSKNKIYNACKKVGIHDYILSLPNSYQTDLSTNQNILSVEKKFLLSLARSLLLKTEILLIYEFPSSLSEAELSNIITLLRTLKKEKTIIIFSAKNYTEKNNDQTYLIENGIVKKQKQNYSKSKIKVDSDFSK